MAKEREYPSWRYHRDGRGKIVKSAAEDAALIAEDWRRSPADFKEEEPPPAKPFPAIFLKRPRRFAP